MNSIDHIWAIKNTNYMAKIKHKELIRAVIRVEKPKILFN